MLMRDSGICFGHRLLLASNSCPGRPAVEVTAVAQVNEQGAVFVAECVFKSELAGASHLGFDLRGRIPKGSLFVLPSNE